MSTLAGMTGHTGCTGQMLFGLVLVFASVIGGSTYDLSPYASVDHLEVYLQPAGGRGGQPFEVQPIVAALDASNRIVDTSIAYNHTVLYAALAKVPADSIFTELKQENTSAFETPFTVFENGWANFTGLSIDDLGSDFSINFFSYDLARQVESEVFNVTLGDPDRISLVLPPGTLHNPKVNRR